MSLTVISIHALREEGDRWAVIEMVASYDFYPRPPRGGRPASGQIIQIFFLFLSTPSARRATLGLYKQLGLIYEISIHALREEGDRRRRCAASWA